MYKAKVLTCIAPEPGYRETLARRGLPPSIFQSVIARQRSQNARQRYPTTAETLPSVSGMTHGNEDIAGDDTVVRSLPSVDARQSRCRAYCALCRAMMSHGKASISGSEVGRQAKPNKGIDENRSVSK
jgi:hypothetical protein